MRVVERWIGSDAHELPGADLDDGHACIVVKVGDYVIRHAFHLKSLRGIRRAGYATTSRGTILAGGFDS